MQDNEITQFFSRTNKPKDDIKTLSLFTTGKKAVKDQGAAVQEVKEKLIKIEVTTSDLQACMICYKKVKTQYNSTKKFEVKDEEAIKVYKNFLNRFTDVKNVNETIIVRETINYYAAVCADMVRTNLHLVNSRTLGFCMPPKDINVLFGNRVNARVAENENFKKGNFEITERYLPSLFNLLDYYAVKDEKARVFYLKLVTTVVVHWSKEFGIISKGKEISAVIKEIMDHLHEKVFFQTGTVGIGSTKLD